VLASTTAPWQVELVMNEDREKVAWLIARLESRKRVEALLAGPSIEEWKIKILSKVRSEASNMFQNSELFAYNIFY